MPSWNEAILRIARAGNWFRVSDGRWTHGYVNVASLNVLIESGKLEKFDQNGVTMARLPERIGEPSVRDDAAGGKDGECQP